MYEIKLLEEAENWLFDLPLAERDEMLTLINMLEKLGYELAYPYSKHLTGTKEKIKELRCKKFGNRLYYFHLKNKIYIGLLGGDKDSQIRDIKLADKKAKAIKQNKGVLA